MIRGVSDECGSISFHAGHALYRCHPIGNLEDITLRALRVLKEVDVIAAEDTRHTQILLSHHDIHTPLTSYHEHNEKPKPRTWLPGLRGVRILPWCLMRARQRSPIRAFD